MADPCNQTTIPIPTLTQDQKDYIAKLDKANVRPGDPRLQEPLVTPRTTEQNPSSAYLWQACNVLEAAHEHEDLERAKGMLDRYGLTYKTAIAELERRGVIGPALVSDERR